MSTAESLYDLNFTTNRGDTVPLSEYTGRPVLIVNTASKCGFTPQYQGLQELHETYADRGLVVLGIRVINLLSRSPAPTTTSRSSARSIMA